MQRYRLKIRYGIKRLDPVPDGEWVKYDDIIKLLEDIATELHAYGDSAYSDYIQQMMREPCLGWEQKVMDGKFGDLELSSHTLGGNFHGQHCAYRRAENIVRGIITRKD